MDIVTREMKIKIKSKNRKEKISVKPFLKWAGGKTQLLPEIFNNLPFELENSKIKKYFEPFIGSGAVLFELISHYDFDEVVINDMNEKLINVYNMIQNDVNKLIERLQILETECLGLDELKRKEEYYRIRENYNRGNIGKIEEAAYFIFLNRTCFNGLYRVNKKGEYNVPMGSYSNPRICDRENLLAVSSKLQKITITQGDFESILDKVDGNSFVYFDPPYRPLNVTSSFTDYAKESFNDDSQKRLAEFCKKLDAKGAKLLLSNSDPKNNDVIDDFFDDLYQKFSIQRVLAKRMINSKAGSRGEITELLIKNY